MFVSDSKTSYMRGMIPAKASRNMDFISFQFKQEGLVRFVLIPIDDLKKCIEELDDIKDRKKISISVNVDQAVNSETLLYEFNARRDWLSEFTESQRRLE